MDYIIGAGKGHDAKGIIVLMTKFCIDPEEFDYVPIKRHEQAGLLNLNIEVDRQMVNYERAATMIQAFKEMSCNKMSIEAGRNRPLCDIKELWNYVRGKPFIEQDLQKK